MASFRDAHMAPTPKRGAGGKQTYFVSFSINFSTMLAGTSS